MVFHGALENDYAARVVADLVAPGGHGGGTPGAPGFVVPAAGLAGLTRLGLDHRGRSLHTAIRALGGSAPGVCLGLNLGFCFGLEPGVCLGFGLGFRLAIGLGLGVAFGAGLGPALGAGLVHALGLGAGFLRLALGLGAGRGAHGECQGEDQGCEVREIFHGISFVVRGFLSKSKPHN